MTEDKGVWFVEWSGGSFVLGVLCVCLLIVYTTVLDLLDVIEERQATLLRHFRHILLVMTDTALWSFSLSDFFGDGQAPQSA